MTVLKSIVVCLALTNVGCFLWIRGIVKSQAVPVAATPVMTLKLASEAVGAPQGAVAGTGDSAATDQATPGPVAVASP